MTGFPAATTFVNAWNLGTMTGGAFTAFFINHGMLRLIIIDSGTKFAGAMKTQCQNIRLPQHYTVSKGICKAIRCKRFHRYLNKVHQQHYQAANCRTFQDFMFRNIFAVYAWNSAPVDGTKNCQIISGNRMRIPIPHWFQTQTDHSKRLTQVANKGPAIYRKPESTTTDKDGKQKVLQFYIREQANSKERQLRNYRCDWPKILSSCQIWLTFEELEQ